jgi:hypothetical protein
MKKNIQHTLHNHAPIHNTIDYLVETPYLHRDAQFGRLYIGCDIA